MGSATRFSAWFRPALFFGAFAAGVLHVALNFSMAVTRSPADALVFTAYLALGAVVGLLAVNAVLVVANRGDDFAKLARRCFAVDLFLVLAGIGGLFYVVAQRPFWMGNLWQAFGLVVFVVLAAIASFVFARIWNRPVGRNCAIVALGAFLAPVVGVLLEPATPPGPEAGSIEVQRTPERPILLIGFDGCTWDVLDPLIEAGRVPNFARMVSQGASGTLRSEIAVNMPLANSASKGMRTPVIWETIITGAHPREHGIWDFFFTILPGLSNPLPLRLPGIGGFAREKPVYSTDSRARSLWEIYEDFGFDSLLVGWVHSWPAFEVGGCVCVSDRITYESKLMTYPPAFEKEFAWMYRDFPQIARERFDTEFDPNAFVQLDPDDPEFEAQNEMRKKIAAEKSDWLLRGRQRDVAREVFGFDLDPDYADKFGKDTPQYWAHHLVRNETSDLATDNYTADVTVQLLAKARAENGKQPDFTACYFSSTDTVQHWFWKYYEPEAFDDVDPWAVEQVGQAIPQVYENADRILGQLLDAVDESTTVIIVSDHGGGAWLEMGSSVSGEHEGYSGNHRDNGVILAMGPDVARGVKLPDSTIYDVMPLLLHLSGLPAGENMRGGLPAGLFGIDRGPLRRIEHYGPRQLPPEILKALELGGSGDAAYMQKLQELGYVGGD